MVKKLMVFPSSSGAVASGHWCRLWTCPSFCWPGESQSFAMFLSAFNTPIQREEPAEKMQPRWIGCPPRLLASRAAFWATSLLPLASANVVARLLFSWWSSKGWSGWRKEKLQPDGGFYCRNWDCETWGRNFLIIIFCSNRNLTTFWKFKLSPNFVSLF